ncbi:MULTISPECIES: hypothetical protein [unclassified Pseudomonas]|uniref:rhamnosyltransferase WsaF family glycosyltransferase n=1 Tax=unclassified Pseudomonas TaxID=196821 RepID=UPI002AC895CB|nr:MULTISPECIES: hypothetical protein [unclassified Pseudomonas]MEB0047239.1 hypothetical protein [Pseudomonas sp. Dout3]MEB0096879.1 hypothetical protein [Pseudomonas sp. DC1.2]WPX57392.1 hypothetical protein RHM68_17405 [Pseudomonas sp. DC1.2]
MLRKIVRFALRNPQMHAALRRVYLACTPSAGVESGLQVSVPEASPIFARKSSLSGLRLNLVVPALSTRHVFGGISTALHFFQEMAVHFEDVRIVVTDEMAFAGSDNPDFADWTILSLTDNDHAGKTIVSAGDRSKHTLALRENDVFIATAWWTASAIKKLLAQRKAFWPGCSEGKFVYLIQDYEPGFYPWSSRYALAEASYHDGRDCVAVFNTSFLQDYFDAKGYEFNNKFVFEPVLNKSLRPFLLACPHKARERTILVYGRPSVSRNCFELIVMALRDVVSTTDCRGWTFCSAGEAHPNIDLGKGFSLKSLGKLSIDEYGAQLQKTFAGISLMVSPHPSYPPLEMAAFGINVLTNGYDEKNLSSLSDNIHSVDYLSTESLSGKVISIMERYSSDAYGHLPQAPYFQKFREVENPFGHIIAALVGDIKTSGYKSGV